MTSQFRFAGPLALLCAAGLSAGLAAQSSRPAVTRAVPLEIVCGAQASLSAPNQTLRVIGGLERSKRLFATGESILVNAGSTQGLRVGQRFYVRRVIQDRFAQRTMEVQPRSIHTSGWVTIDEVQADVSTASVTEACDGVAEGDYLDPMIVPEVVKPSDGGAPDFTRPALVILGDDRRQLGGQGSLMVIDRGTDHGLRPGQRLTIYRETADGAGPIVRTGDAFIVSTQPDTSLMRILKSREPIQVGDKVAIHR
jgi:hypothetical protein